MKILKRVKILDTVPPVSDIGFLYDAQVWASVDGGKSFVYSGEGKFFVNLSDALEFKEKVENCN